MAAIISPNMSLPIPAVGTTPGPDYAQDNNDSLTLVDQHDHTPGKGVAITPSGLDINADLSMNSHALIDISKLVLITSSSASTTPLSLSVAPGGESPQQQDLWYTPDTGVPIQITKNGAVNVVASSIEGETYAAGTFFWTQAQDALPTTPANFDIGSVTIRPNTALTMLGVTLQPASAITSQYSINLPLIPATKSILTLDLSGNMVADTTVDNSTIEISSNIIQVKNQGITAAKILNNTITTNQISLTASITQGQLDTAALAWRTTTLTPVVASFAVRVATTANGTFTTAFDNGSPIDGVTIATNDLILIKNQTNAAENGVYVVQASGSPVRSTSYDTVGELNYAAVTVTAGTTNASTSWFQNNILALITDLQTWSRSSTQAFTVPAGVNFIRALAFGGGGGGGSGAFMLSAQNNPQGGSGGAGSSPQELLIPVTPAEVISITLGHGGPGAPARSVPSSSSGAAGTDGENTVIVTSAKTYTFKGGIAGIGGLSNTNTTAAGLADTYYAAGSNSAAGGGGGGTLSAGGTSQAGVAGGITSYYPTAAAGGAARASSATGAGGGGGGAGGASYGTGGTGGNGGSQAQLAIAGGNGSLGGGGGGAGGYGKSAGTTDTAVAGGNGGDGGAILTYLKGAS